MGAVLEHGVCALFVSDLTRVVCGQRILYICISPATLLEIGTVADGRIKLRLA